MVVGAIVAGARSSWPRVRHHQHVAGQSSRALSSARWGHYSRYRGGASGRRSQAPLLAVPFQQHDAAAASSEFVAWSTRKWQDSWVFDSSAMKLTRVHAVYLPFFAFEGSLQATFDGRLGYTTAQTNLDSSTNWYRKDGMQLPPIAVDAVSDPGMLQYAGFEFRRSYINQAVSCDGMGFGGLRHAMPLYEGMLPEGCGVHAFELKPSRAFRELPLRPPPPSHARA